MSESGRKISYVADTTVKETFCDAVVGVGFDGVNVRIELGVTRIVQGVSGREETLHPVTRLVLSLNSVNELMGKLGNALADLEKQGVIRKGAGGVPARN